MEVAKAKPRPGISRHLSFAVVLALGFASGWIIERSKPPPNPNNPNNGIYDDKENSGKDTVTFWGWPGSNTVVVPTLQHESFYDICFGRTPDRGSIVCVRDLRDPNSRWIPIYKYDLVFGKDDSDGGVIISAREWGNTNGSLITALKYRMEYERDAKGDIIVRVGDWFKTNAPLSPVLSIPAHE